MRAYGFNTMDLCGMDEKPQQTLVGCFWCTSEPWVAPLLTHAQTHRTHKNTRQTSVHSPIHAYSAQSQGIKDRDGKEKLTKGNVRRYAVSECVCVFGGWAVYDCFPIRSLLVLIQPFVYGVLIFLVHIGFHGSRFARSAPGGR